jgi:transposase
VSEASRLRELTEAGLLHANPAAVVAPLFSAGGEFFLAADKVQVKYEMLRTHYVDGTNATTAASTHGYSRAGFYLVEGAFSESGMIGLLDERRGRKGPLRVTDEIVGFLQAAATDRTTPSLVTEVAERFGVTLHRRTIERTRRR